MLGGLSSKKSCNLHLSPVCLVGRTRKEWPPLIGQRVTSWDVDSPSLSVTSAYTDVKLGFCCVDGESLIQEGRYGKAASGQSMVRPHQLTRNDQTAQKWSLCWCLEKWQMRPWRSQVVQKRYLWYVTGMITWTVSLKNVITRNVSKTRVFKRKAKPR